METNNPWAALRGLSTIGTESATAPNWNRALEEARGKLQIRQGKYPSLMDLYGPMQPEAAPVAAPQTPGPLGLG